MKMKRTSKPKKEGKLLLKLLDGDRQRHRVSLVTEEGEWNQHEPNSGTARMFVIMLLLHVVVIIGIIVFDFMGEDKTPQQAVTQAARAMTSSTDLPQAAIEVRTSQAQAAADTEKYDNYEMRSGDSLRSIAAKVGSTEEELSRLNMIDKGLQIGPGTMLRVPKQAVPSAIPVDPKTLAPVTAGNEVPKAIPVQDQPPATVKEPSEAVKPADAPASLSAAMTPMSLLTPSEAAPSGGALSEANTPATSAAPVEKAPELPRPTKKPQIVSLLNQSKAEPESEKPAAKPASKPLAKPNPVPPPAQMLRKIAETPPPSSRKKTEATGKSTDSPPPTKRSESARKTAETTKPAGKSAQTHTLQAGETLYRLSTRYGVSVSAIQKANNIKNPNAMREGMRLVIPAK